MFEIAETEYGKVKGIRKVSAMDTEYISFQGIPYMKAPLGKLRFRDAEKPDSWKNTLDVTEDAPSYCTRNMLTFEYEGQENAAIINVFTKNLKPSKLYPVMVWIHGGGFRLGSSKTDTYGPDYLLQKDVIFVSFNYRLGIIGFLSLQDKALNVPGNAGLKDQIFALNWIKRNIKNFGGDPDNVTLFGESAGGASVHYLTICEQAKGLFHRAIIMSGSAFSKSWALIPRDISATLTDTFARKLGWTGKIGDERDMLNFLEDATAYDIMEAHNSIISNYYEFERGIFNAFAPIIEPYHSSNCLIYKDPVEMARDAWSNDIDVIFSATSLEGCVRAFSKLEVAYFYLENPAYFAPLIELNLDSTDPIAKEYGERIKKLYYKENEQPAMENQHQYFLHQSDSMIFHDIYRSVRSRMAYSTKKTFLLRFHVNGTLNYFRKLFTCEKYQEASHGDDLFYLFKTIHLPVPAKDSNELKTIEKMVSIFTNFAINGNPNCMEVEFNAQINANKLKCLQITEENVTEIDLPELPRMEVWNSVYNDHDVSLF